METVTADDVKGGMLSLQDKFLDVVPDNLENFDIEILDLTMNHIEDIRPICKIKTLVRLVLNFNCIKKIPREILNLKHLKYLWLNFNSLKKIPRWLSKLDLIEFAIYGNYITEIPPTIFQPNLKYLCVAYNKISSVPREIKNAKNLQFLSLTGMNVKLPNEICRSRKLAQFVIKPKKVKYFPTRFYKLKLFDCYLDFYQTTQATRGTRSLTPNLNLLQPVQEFI